RTCGFRYSPASVNRGLPVVKSSLRGPRVEACRLAPRASAGRDAAVHESRERIEELVQIARAAHRVEGEPVAPDLDPVVLAPRAEVARELVARQRRPHEIDAKVPATVLLRPDRDSVLVLPLAVALRGIPRPQCVQHPPPFPTRSLLAARGNGTPGSAGQLERDDLDVVGAIRAERVVELAAELARLEQLLGDVRAADQL